MSFSINPDITTLNGNIRGNAELPTLSERLSEKSLVVIPYRSTLPAYHFYLQGIHPH